MWDESLYAGSAPYYAEGRLPYPPAVADILRDRLGLDGHGRLLDLGCGPGSLTLMLAPWYAEVVAVDADRGPRRLRHGDARPVVSLDGPTGGRRRDRPAAHN